MEFWSVDVPKYRRKGLLDDEPIRFRAAGNEVEPTPLRFPGKILADGKSKRIFIADSSHNRIVVTSFDGEISAVIGSGSQGHRDDAFDEATFSSPQAMALHEDVLYVADTYNNNVKVIDLLEADIRTVAGEANSGSPDLPRPFDEPAGLSVAEGMIFVADTNNHLSRVIDNETGKVKTLALDGLLAPILGSRNEEGGQE